MFPLPPKDLAVPKAVVSRKSILSPHMVITYCGRKVKVSFGILNNVQGWVLQAADHVAYLTKPEYDSSYLPEGEYLYDELVEGGTVTLRVVRALQGVGGFFMPRKLSGHVTSEMVGHNLTWRRVAVQS